MARIRSIHPGIFTDEAFMGLTVECPLAIPLLLGLWAEADDAGSFEWKPLTLKARILPAATCDTPELLGVLVAANFIRRFEIDGRLIGVIRNFVKFQRPKSPLDSHPFTSESRAFAGFEIDGKRPHSGTGRPPSKEYPELLPNDFVTPTENPPQRKEEGGRRKEEVKPEIQETSQEGLVASPTAPRKAKRAKARTQIAEDAQPDGKDCAIAEEHGLSAELFRAEWRKFRSCHLAKGSLFANWHEAWRNWCEKIPEFQRQAPRAGPRQGGSGLAQISLEMATENHVKRQENPTGSVILGLPGIGEPEPGGHRNIDSLISASFKRI